MEKILGSWMKTHNSVAWSIGIHWVAWIKNNRYHSTTDFTPYQLQYGVISRNKLLNLPLDPHLLSSLQTETELMKHHKFDVSDSESEDEDVQANPIVSPDSESSQYGLVSFRTVLIDNNPLSFAMRRRSDLIKEGVTRNVLQSALQVEVEEENADITDSTPWVETAFIDPDYTAASEEGYDEEPCTYLDDFPIDDHIGKGVLIPETALSQDVTEDIDEAEYNDSQGQGTQDLVDTEASTDQVD